MLGSALHECVKQRQNGGKVAHIPFRDNALSHYLKPSLINPSNFRLILNVSPHKFHVNETIRTLRFGKKTTMLGGGSKTTMITTTEKAKTKTKVNIQEKQQPERANERKEDERLVTTIANSNLPAVETVEKNEYVYTAKDEEKELAVQEKDEAPPVHGYDLSNVAFHLRQYIVKPVTWPFCVAKPRMFWKIRTQ